MHTSIRLIGLAFALFSAPALACDTSPTIASADGFSDASTPLEKLSEIAILLICLP